MPYYIDTPEGQTDVIPDDIHSVQDIRFLDPCMGSGHILVYAFDLLCKMYEEEGFMPKEIPGMVLENNIFGMDIDLRCYQLTCFALTMKARAYYSRYLRRTVQPNVIALKKIDHDVIASCDAWPTKSLMWQFENIDTIGSLLKVSEEEYEKIPVSTGLFGPLQKELKDQARFLSRKYHCVVTNPPYLGKGFGDALKNYVNEQFPSSKSDLYAAFIEHLSNLPCKDGFTAMVTMESWMFIPTYEDLRRSLISNQSILSLSHFDWYIMRIAFGTVSFILQNRKNQGDKGVYSYLNRSDVDMDKEIPYSFPNKENGRFSHMLQSDFLRIPGSPIGYWVSQRFIDNFKSEKIENTSEVITGMTIGDNVKYLRLWYETDYKRVSINKSSMSDVDIQHAYWIPYSKGGERRQYYGNFDHVVNWSMRDNFNRAKKSLSHLYLRKALTWPFVTSGKFSARYLPEGSLWDVAGSPCFFENDKDLKYVLGFLNSDVADYILSVTNPTINVQAIDVKHLPYICKNQDFIADTVEENISISKKDWDAHETSWDFQVNELVWMAQHATAWDGSALEDKALPIASLVDAYKEKWTEMFHMLHKNEEELNRQFIEIYGLQDELTPDVPLNEVTILQKGEISIDEDNRVIWHDDVIVKQLISYFVGCFMGRYSVDKPGLIIASQGMSVDSLGIENPTLEIDDDAIIPIISEPDFFADDMTQRIEKAMRLLFGESAFYDNMRYIKACLGKELRDYLYSDFYTEHIKMYTVKSDRRPIYWLFSSKMGDKKKSGCFKALVYMHRLEPDTLSRLHAEYVLPYRNKLEQQLREASDEATRDDLSTAARNRAIRAVDELQAKVREVREYETVLVEMASHRLSIDLDEGVRINYPKYYPLVEPIKGLDSAEE